MFRPDFIFSYWIFAWFLLYYFGFISFNPKFAIICGIIENLIVMASMFYYHTKIKLIFLFFIMFLILKMIPIFAIWREKMKFEDIITTFILFIIYLFWVIVVNKKSISDFTRQTSDLIIHNKNTLPGMLVLDKLGIF
jgi:hypothetical protein